MNQVTEKKILELSGKNELDIQENKTKQKGTQNLKIHQCLLEIALKFFLVMLLENNLCFQSVTV